jgi:hypothetical protein
MNFGDMQTFSQVQQAMKTATTKQTTNQGPVAHAYNPSYLGG